MKLIKGCLKVILAGIVAVIIISVMILPYSFTPVHINSKFNNTDYVWPSNSIWMTMTEGISFGKYDNNGFNNSKVIDNPDIVIVGSSHMEATNVMQNENLGYLLNEAFKGRYSVYNMGISGHTIYKVSQYLPQTLSVFDTPPKMVLIETADVNLNMEDVNKVIQKKVEFTPSHSTGVIAYMQKIPFLRLAYKQADSGLIDLFMPENKDDSDVTADVFDKKKKFVDIKAYDEFFKYLNSLEEKYQTEIIIFNHPMELLQADGSIQFENTNCLKMFSTYAKHYGITFVDMTEGFRKMYYEENKVPHGFSTGKIASGHLNANGHRVIADELFKTITYLEEGSK